jgi:multiple sugar transport system permease protein
MRRGELTAALFLLPNALGFLIFAALPIAAAAGIALTDWDALTAPRPVGLRNFAALLAGDRLFVQVVANTLAFTLGVVPLTIALALGLAIALDRPLRGATLFRSIFFLPVVASSVAVGVLWQWLYHPDLGLLNWALSQAGVAPHPWVSSADWAMPSLILAAVWKSFGYDVLIFLAGLRTIPRHLYEAAGIDGASGWQRFRHVTLPMLAPTTFLVLVISIVRTFQVFDLAYVLTRGGPANATNTVAMFIYLNAFHFFKMGYAAAAAWLLFLAVLAFTLVQTRLQRGWVGHE